MFPLSASCSFRQGDWRGISRHFVQSRTPTQVASHAQKYFIRQNNMNKRKRRSSLFDIVNEAPEEPAKAGGRVDGVASGSGGATRRRGFGALPDDEARWAASRFLPSLLIKN